MVWAFVEEFDDTMGKHFDLIPKSSIESLQRYPWPGNVRELRNVIERAVIASKGKLLQVEIPGSMRSKTEADMTLEGCKHRHILKVFETVQWRIKGKGGAAELLGLKPSTLHFRMKKLGIQRPA